MWVRYTHTRLSIEFHCSSTTGCVGKKMAVVWDGVSGDDHYQVRTAGGSVRLYRNKVFHSQWNSNRPLSGGVWDLLFLPALFMPQESLQRVLLLGVGGGAVIRQYQTLLPVKQVVGVELDPIHIKIAHEYFGLDQPGVELIEADAINWVHQYRGPKFDIVIEDLFTEIEGEPVRVKEADAEWFLQLHELIRPGGTLIVNFEDPAQLRESNRVYPAVTDVAEDNRFAFTLPTYGNCVGAYLSVPSEPGTLRDKLDKILVGYPASRASAQKFRVRRVRAK